MISAAEELPDGFAGGLSNEVPQGDVAGRDGIYHETCIVAAVSGEVVDAVAQLHAVEGVLTDECGGDEFADDLAYGVGDEGALGFAPANEAIIGCDANEEAFGTQIVG